MPQVPVLTANFNQGITEGHPGILRLPNATPQQFGAGAGEQLSDFGAALAKVGRRVQEQEDDLALAKKSGDYAVGLDEFHRSVLSDSSLTTTEQRTTAFRERADALLATLNEGASPSVQRALSVHAAGAFSRGSIRLVTEDYERRLDASRTNLSVEQDRKGMTEGTAIALGDFDGAAVQRAERTDMLERAERHGTITARERIVMDRSATDAAWRMVAQRNPDYLLDVQAGVLAGEGHPAGMDPERLSVYANEARLAVRGREAEARQTAAAAKAAKAEREATIQNEFLKKIQLGALTTDDILTSDLDPVGVGSKEHFINVLAARGKEKSKPIQANHRLFADTMRDIRSLNITTEQQLDQLFIESARAGHGIDYDDLLKLRREFEELKTPDGQTLARRKDLLFDGVKHSITDSVLDRNDPDGDAMYAQYQSWAQGQLEQARAQGKNPHLLLMPRIGGKENPDYLGRPEALAPFQRTLKEQITGLSQKLRRTERPSLLEPMPNDRTRKPGETYAQWRKRTQ